MLFWVSYVHVFGGFFLFVCFVGFFFFLYLHLFTANEHVSHGKALQKYAHYHYYFYRGAKACMTGVKQCTAWRFVLQHKAKFTSQTQVETTVHSL